MNKMFKLIFKIIKWTILLLLVIFLLAFPLIVFDKNPFIFYWDSIEIIWDFFRDSNFFGNLWDLIKSKF